MSKQFYQKKPSDSQFTSCLMQTGPALRHKRSELSGAKASRISQIDKCIWGILRPRMKIHFEVNTSMQISTGSGNTRNVFECQASGHPANHSAVLEANFDRSNGPNSCSVPGFGKDESLIKCLYVANRLRSANDALFPLTKPSKPSQMLKQTLFLDEWAIYSSVPSQKILFFVNDNACIYIYTVYWSGCIPSSLLELTNKHWICACPLATSSWSRRSPHYSLYTCHQCMDS